MSSNSPILTQKRTIFYNNGSTSINSFQKPTNAKIMIFTLLGGGGGGGAGRSSALGTAAFGGGGGGCQAPVVFVVPACVLPDIIYYSVGRGGNGGAPSAGASGGSGEQGTSTYISMVPSASGNLESGYGGAGGGGTNSAGGGAGGSVSAQVGRSLGQAGITTNGFSFAGTIGTANTAATSSVWQGFSGGGAGSGVDSGNSIATSSTAGITLNTYVSDILGAAAGSSAHGSNGISQLLTNQHPLWATGGAGGGGATGTNSRGGNGGAGGFGCGGGGGGGANGTNCLGGFGGKGGDGLLIVEWF
jgi:hypothetical protein